MDTVARIRLGKPAARSLRVRSIDAYLAGDLRRLYYRYHLGDDVFDPRDNIFGRLSCSPSNYGDYLMHRHTGGGKLFC